ncbi:MAG: hypothetical protein GY805_01485 [Chloroflexi bacterium]|nr:hypothetical protein [Chloroflexota bacterium]
MLAKEKKHILIIQETEYAHLAMAFLNRSGFNNIHIASSRNIALSIIEEVTPDLIILAHRPIEKNGYSGVEFFYQLGMRIK